MSRTSPHRAVESYVPPKRNSAEPQPGGVPEVVTSLARPTTSSSSWPSSSLSSLPSCHLLCLGDPGSPALPSLSIPHLARMPTKVKKNPRKKHKLLCSAAGAPRPVVMTLLVSGGRDSTPRRGPYQAHVYACRACYAMLISSHGPARERDMPPAHIAECGVRPAGRVAGPRRTRPRRSEPRARVSSGRRRVPRARAARQERWLPERYWRRVPVPRGEGRILHRQVRASPGAGARGSCRRRAGDVRCPEHARFRARTADWRAYDMAA